MADPLHPTETGLAGAGDERISVVVALKRPLDLDFPEHGAPWLAEAFQLLTRLGFEIATTGRQSIVVVGTVARFEEVFKSKIERREIVDAWNCSSNVEHIVLVPADFRAVPGWVDASGVAVDADQVGRMAQHVQSVTVERPHIYLSPLPDDPCVAAPARLPRPWSNLDAGFAAVKAKPPKLQDGLSAIDLSGVASLLRADEVHKANIRGRGVRVAMIDTGFAHGHPYFAENRFASKVCLAPLISEASTAFDTDRKGHGTGESANLFAVAPDVELIGIKVTPDRAGPDCPLLAPFLAALRHRPRIVSLSMTYDLADKGSRLPEAKLREDLEALHDEIAKAVAAGTIVVAGTGNGQFGFPAQMPEVIAAGGVFAHGADLRASSFASAFHSPIYAGRHVPDCCGLVGEAPAGRYIMLPLPPGSEYDQQAAAEGGAQGDGTEAADGWAVFSGTSAAAPQLAGVCALMLSANPQLTPADVRRILCETARPVDKGSAHSDCAIPPISANPPGAALTGRDATGAGLVDAFAAVQRALAEAGARPGG